MITKRKTKINSKKKLKKFLRDKILRMMKTQKEDLRLEKSRKIQAKLFRLGVFKKAKAILFYISFGGEVETLSMIKKALKKGKKIAVPVCDKKRKVLTPCSLTEPDTQLAGGAYCIPEPVHKELFNTGDIDLVVVPAVVFDESGNRLGRGLGYYDKFLKNLPDRICRIGLAFDFQIVKSLEDLIEPQDIPVHKVIFA